MYGLTLSYQLSLKVRNIWLCITYTRNYNSGKHSSVLRNDASWGCRLFMCVCVCVCVCLCVYIYTYIYIYIVGFVATICRVKTAVRTSNFATFWHFTLTARWLQFVAIASVFRYSANFPFSYYVYGLPFRRATLKYWSIILNFFTDTKCNKILIFAMEILRDFSEFLDNNYTN